MVMKRVMVSDLKARLSAYLSAVRGGETVIVSDRRTPIARIVPYAEDRPGLLIDEPRRPARDLVRRKLVATKSRLDVLQLLRDDRDQR
jgi:prevent-host-death family protein